MHALLLARCKDHAEATWEEWKEFEDILDRSATDEEKICAIAEERGRRVSMQTMRTMMAQVMESQKQDGETADEDIIAMNDKVGDLIHEGGNPNEKTIV